MDLTAIFIIVISTVLAIVFKVVIFKKIRRWMEQDLIKGLAADNREKHDFLHTQLAQMKREGVSRKEFQARLTHCADEFDSGR